MNNTKGHTLTITNKSGEETEYEILFTFTSEETKENYIIFTDNEKDESGSIITYAATYQDNNGKLELEDIKTEKEWNLIENLLAQIEDKIEE